VPPEADKVKVTGAFLTVITSRQLATGFGSPTLMVVVAGAESRTPSFALNVKLSGPQKLRFGV
jgi:hypothetical protein